MSNPIQLPTLVTNLSTLKDGSIKITLVTSREMNDSDAAILFGFRNKEAWTLMASSEMTEDVKLPSERPDPAVGTKTPSQRLRAVLYRLWEQNPSGTDFESFYRIKLEQVIDKFKERLE